MFLFKMFGFVTGLSTMVMTEKQCYQHLKIMEQKLLQEEAILYNHLTDERWKNILTSNVHEFKRWTLASASLGRYLHRLDISPLAHRRELEELITFVKGHLAELESQWINNSLPVESLVEDGFEVVDKAEVSYHQIKDEWENYLRKLERQRLIEFGRQERIEKNHYQVLGVDRDALPEEIKETYRKLALEWHPDRWNAKTEAEKKIAEEKFKEINQAYQVLSDLEKRREYDRNI